MREVTLRLPASDSWISSLHGPQKASVRILDCRPADDSLTLLVEVTAQDEELNGVLDEIRRSHDVIDARLIKTKRGRLMGTVLVKGHSVAKAVLEAGAFCKSCLLLEPPGPDKRVEWRIALDDEHPIQTLLKKISATGIDAEVRSVSTASSSQTLTQRQEALLELATNRGYYEFPRRISITELAKTEGITAATASEILRTAEKKIVGNYIYAKREKPNNHKTATCLSS